MAPLSRRTSVRSVIRAHRPCLSLHDPRPAGGITDQAAPPCARVKVVCAERQGTTPPEDESQDMCLPATLESVSCQKASKGARHLSRRTLLAGGGGAAAAAAFPATASAVRPAKLRFHDLTHVLTEGFPVFTFDPPTRETLTTIPGDGFYAQQWTLAEHSGTHMDVPGHFIVGGRLAAEITPEELIVPIVVIDISVRAARDSDTVLTVDDLTRFERRNGQIPNGALVCMDSGWPPRSVTRSRTRAAPRFPTTTSPASTSTPQCGSLSAATWPVSGWTRSASTQAARRRFRSTSTSSPRTVTALRT
jgi:Putative cyclase